MNYFDAIICAPARRRDLPTTGMLEPWSRYAACRGPRSQAMGGGIWEDNVSTHKLFYIHSRRRGDHGSGQYQHGESENSKASTTIKNPKWKGKIFSVSAGASSGSRFWSFMWSSKARASSKIVQQELFLTRDLRQLTDSLARQGAVAFGIGQPGRSLHRSSGLPLKPVPALKKAACKQFLRCYRHHQESAQPQCHQVSQLVFSARGSRLVRQKSWKTARAVSTLKRMVEQDRCQRGEGHHYVQEYHSCANIWKISTPR